VRSSSSWRQLLDPPLHDRVHAGGIWTPLRTTSMPMSARTVSKGAGYLPSPVADHVPGPAACVFKIHREVPRRLRHPGGGWLGGGAQVRIRRLACSIAARTYIRAPVKVTVSKKSAARMAAACERRNAAQLSALRSGAGSMPASVRNSQSVDAAALTPRTSSSPWMRHAGRERDHQSLRHPPVARTHILPGSDGETEDGTGQCRRRRRQSHRPHEAQDDRRDRGAAPAGSRGCHRSHRPTRLRRR
jgi:hypothetical protein